MAHNFWVIAISALFVVCASGLEGEREGWFPGPGGDTKPVSPTIIGVRGAIFCKKGLKLTPIEGACAKVTCAAKGKKPFTIISAPSDKKGFFMATLSLHEIELNWNLKKDCKAYLHSSPFNYCHVKTNLNNGLSGAPLKTSKSIPKQHLKVFYVGSFAFTQRLRA
ncbi:hypothetical protein QQ045_030088 [Rhodiola kirilowii]